MYRLAERLVKRDAGLVLHCGHVNAGMAADVRYLLWTHALEIMDECGEDCSGDARSGTGDRQQRVWRGVCAVGGRGCGASGEDFAGSGCGEDASGIGLPGRPTLLTVARIVKANRYKGHDVALRALAKVKSEIPDVAYVIAGEGDDRDYLEQLARECGVRENVVFAGSVTDEELPLVYNACDAFVMCSREERTRRGILAEGFGLAFMEASAGGKPVIAGRSRGVADAVKDGVTGVLIDPTNVDEVAAAMTRVLRDRDLAERLARMGAWVEAEMNWKRAGDEFEDAMRKFFPQNFCEAEAA